MQILLKCNFEESFSNLIQIFFITSLLEEFVFCSIFLLFISFAVLTQVGIFPEKRRNEILKFIKGGLQDISISRLKEKVYWGIELPFDKKQTCFVWIDAFWNYVSGLKNKKEKFSY